MSVRILRVSVLMLHIFLGRFMSVHNNFIVVMVHVMELDAKHTLNWLPNMSIPRVYKPEYTG